MNDNMIYPSDGVAEATIKELRRQRDILAGQVKEMRDLINSFPSQLAMARLDAMEGKQTKYDFSKAGKACEVRIA